MTDRIHVVIVDNHPLCRQGVSQTLNGAGDIEIAAEGGSADEAVHMTKILQKLQVRNCVEAAMLAQRNARRWPTG